MRQYSKAYLERIVMVQLENLNAMHDLLGIMKVQNELLHNTNKKLKDEISEFKDKLLTYSARKVNQTKTIQKKNRSKLFCKVGFCVGKGGFANLFGESLENFLKSYYT